MLDRNLFDVGADEIGATRVLRTEFEGRTVFEGVVGGDREGVCSAISVRRATIEIWPTTVRTVAGRFPLAARSDAEASVNCGLEAAEKAGGQPGLDRARVSACAAVADTAGPDGTP